MVVGGFTNPFVSTGTDIGNPPGKAKQFLVWILHPANKTGELPDGQDTGSLGSSGIG